MEEEFFDKFVIRYREREMPDGRISSWWDIGQRLKDGGIVWSDDISGKSRDHAIQEGQRVFG